MREHIIEQILKSYDESKDCEVMIDSVEVAYWDNQMRYDAVEEILHLSSGLTTDESYSYQIKIKDAEHLKGVLEQLV